MAGKAMFTADGIMPEGGPETVLDGSFRTFKKDLKGKHDRPLQDLHHRVRQEGEALKH